MDKLENTENLDDVKDAEKQNCSNNLVDDEDTELMEIVLNTREQCQLIDEILKAQINHKDEMIDKLYNDLNKNNQDFIEKYILEFLKSIIKVRNDMKKTIKSDKWENVEKDDLKKEYTYILEDLTDLLEQHDIDVYNTEPGNCFDPSIHHPKIEITDDIELDKKIKISLNDGYKKGEKVVIPERVLVYHFKENSISDMEEEI